MQTARPAGRPSANGRTLSAGVAPETAFPLTLKQFPISVPSPSDHAHPCFPPRGRKLLVVRLMVFFFLHKTIRRCFYSREFASNLFFYFLLWPRWRTKLAFDCIFCPIFFPTPFTVASLSLKWCGGAAHSGVTPATF